MGRSRRGSGSVFQRTYRDAKGKLRKTQNWYIEFVSGNRTIRGGGWQYNADEARVVNRAPAQVVTRQGVVGFRVAR